MYMGKQGASNCIFSGAPAGYTPLTDGKLAACRVRSFHNRAVPLSRFKMRELNVEVGKIVCAYK